MARTVLIVDDDQTLLRLIQKKLDRFSGQYETVIAENGLEGVKLLKEKTISLVVTDLQMPKMDGFALLAHLTEKYPDIPVIIITAHGKPKTKNVVLQGGAAGYIEKPFKVEELAEKISEALKKETEGGSLHNVALETFIQLIEMEQKTCTIRVFDNKTGKRGVLFFKDGELMNARVDGLQANEAAYRVFSWSQVTLAIENVCSLDKKVIKGDLQAILLEAMRLKDEADEQAELKAAATEPTPKKEPVKPPPVKEAALKPAPVKPKVPDPLPELTLIEKYRRKIEKSLGPKSGLLDLYIDSAYQNLVLQIVNLGEALGAGKLKVCYFDQTAANDYILIPGQETLILTVSPKCQRENILRLFSE